jgi:hypothetical protein
MVSQNMPARGEDHVPRHEAVRGAVCDDYMAKGLGIFSVALGGAEMMAPNEIARLIGIEDQPALVRAFGAREVATGIGILKNSRPTPWLWARVVGDLIDLAALASLPTRSDRGASRRLGLATAAVVGVTLADVLCSIRFTQKAAGQYGSETNFHARTADRERGMAGVA